MIQILYGGNRKVFDGLLISALSIAKNTKQAVTMHILTADLSDIKSDYLPLLSNQGQAIEKVLQSGNKNSKVVLQDITNLFRKEMEKSKNILNFYTPYTFLRLFADQLNLPNKILYLDTDTYITGDLSLLYDIDIEGKEIACVRDYLGHIFFGWNYFNAGVLLFNLKEIKKSGLFTKSIRLCNEKKLFFCDQTALNRYAKEKKYISGRFNRQRGPKKDTVVLHFCKRMCFLPYPHTINIKPWQIEQVHKKYKLFQFDDVLNEYSKRKKMIEEGEA